MRTYLPSLGKAHVVSYLQHALFRDVPTIRNADYPELRTVGLSQ
jgi:hypothetical protein